MVDDLLRDLAQLRLVGGGLLRGEAAGDDAAQSSVLGVVEVDHRGIELAQFLGHLLDVDGDTRAVDAGCAAGVPDVVVTGKRPELGARPAEVAASRRVPAHGLLSPQLREHPRAVLGCRRPEGRVGKVLLVEVDVAVVHGPEAKPLVARTG